MKSSEAIDLALAAIGAEGFDGLKIKARNGTAALKALLAKTSPGPDHRRIMAQLRQQKLVEIKKRGDVVNFRLTPAGLLRLQQSLINKLEIPKPKWDGHWRLVIFDVPVAYSRQRIAFTRRLQELGLKMLQRSVWVHPFPCFEQVEQLAHHYNVIRFCAFAEISKIDSLSHRRLSKYFAETIA